MHYFMAAWNRQAFSPPKLLIRTDFWPLFPGIYPKLLRARYGIEINQKQFFGKIAKNHHASRHDMLVDPLGQSSNQNNAKDKHHNACSFWLWEV